MKLDEDDKPRNGKWKVVIEGHEELCRVIFDMCRKEVPLVNLLNPEGELCLRVTNEFKA